MPILVRPVREQLEHDRVIRLLQAKYKRKFEVGMNAGMEQAAPVGAGTSAIYPDLVLQSTERSRKLLGVVEVETSESVNHLEAMSQWAALGRLRVPFHLYVPANMIDVARRLCADLQIQVAEVWNYHTVGDQIRFTLVQKAPGAVEKPLSSPAAVRPAANGGTRAAAPARRPSAAAPAPRRKPAAPKPSRSRAAAKPARGRAAAPKKKTTAARTQKRK